MSHCRMSHNPRDEVGWPVDEIDAAAHGALYAIFRTAGPDQPGAPERGFLLSRYDEAQFADFLASKKVYAARGEDKFVGFVVVEPVGVERLRNIDWSVDEEDVNMPAATPLLWIRMLAVAPAAGRQGVATALYTHLFRQHVDGCFITGLYECPLENRASRAFHERMGFQRVGASRQQHPAEDRLRVAGIYMWRREHRLPRSSELPER